MTEIGSADRSTFDAEDVEAPYWRTPKEDWPAAQALARQDAGWRAWVADRAARTQQWMSSSTDHADWLTGWGHDYLSSDGRRIEWRPDDVLPSADNAKLRGAWVYWFRRRHVETLEEAAYLYRLTNDSNYLAFVCDQLDFYASNYLNWVDKRRGGSSRIMGQGLDEAMFFIRLAEAARLVRGSVQSQRWQTWRDRLFQPASVQIADSFSRISNITLWQISAAGLLGSLVGDQVLMRRVLDDRFGFRQQMTQGVLGDGLWFEGSLGYNAYALQGILPLVTLLIRQGLQEPYTQELTRVRQMLLAPLRLQFADGGFPNPGDNTGDVVAATIGVLVAARQLLPTPAALLHDTKNWPSLLNMPSPVMAAGGMSPRPLGSVLFEESRMALLRSAGWEAFVHWGQNAAAHSQLEALNIELVYKGVTISRDVGTTSYGSPMHKGFYSQAAAHNVPFADDNGQMGWSPGELIQLNPRGQGVSVSQVDYQNQVSARRRISLSDGLFTDEVQVQRRAPAVVASDNRSIGLSWNFECPLRTSERVSGSLTGFPVAAGFKYWNPLYLISVKDRFRFILDCPGQLFEGEIKIPGVFSVYVAESPSVNKGWRHALYVRRTAAEGAFVTTLRPLAEAKSVGH